MKNSENGFSLVVVLIVIVLITTLGLSLFTLNFNNAKQINLTKEHLVATDLAEMGIIYYETLFTEHSFNVLVDAIEYAKDTIKKENLNKPEESQTPVNPYTVFEHLNLDSNKFINSSINLNMNILDNPDENFKIISHYLLNNSSSEIIVAFKSEGYTRNNNKVVLTGDITINIKSFIYDYFKGIDSWFEIPKIFKIEDIKNINNLCTQNSFNALDNCILRQDISILNSDKSPFMNLTGKIDGKLTIANTGVKITDSVLYITGDVITTGNNTDFSKSTIYSEGFGNFENGGLSDTTLYFKNGVTFHNFTSSVGSSRVYSDGSVEIKNITQLVSDTQFYVNGNLTIGNLTSNMENSKIFVKDQLKISGLKKDSISSSTLICAGSFSESILEYKAANPSAQIYDLQSNPEYFSEGGKCSLSSKPKGELAPTSLLNNLNVNYN